jgi:carbamate kinase
MRIVELPAVKALADAGFVVITVGGGGIPVVADKDGLLRGVPAVIDKDFASSLLATELGADLFVIATAVEQVALDFGTPEQRWVDRMTVSEARGYLAEGTHFAPGSMAPKIEPASGSSTTGPGGRHHGPGAPPPGRPRGGRHAHRPRRLTAFRAARPDYPSGGDGRLVQV